MSNLQTTQRRIARGRTKVAASGKLRLAVSFSSKFVSAQLIDDVKGVTLVGMRSSGKGSLTEQAAELGKNLAVAAVKSGTKTAVLDKRGRMYKQRMVAFTEAARKEGLKV